MRFATLTTSFGALFAATVTAAPSKQQIDHVIHYEADIPAYFNESFTEYKIVAPRATLTEEEKAMKPAGLAKRQYIDYLDCQNADPAPLMDDCDGVIASLASYNELLVRRFQLHKSFPEDFGKQNREANYDYKIVEPGYCHEAVQGTCAAYVCAICDELDVHTTDWANFLQTINSDCVTNGQEGTISDDILYTVGITYNPVELPMYTCSFPHADGPQYFPAQPNLTNGAKKRKALPPA